MDYITLETNKDESLHKLYENMEISKKFEILKSFEEISGIDFFDTILYNYLSLQEKYDFLIEEISRHDKLYEENIPEIGDGFYDELYFELLLIEKNNPKIISKESPSQKVNTVLVNSLEKREHSVPMLSQNKIKTKDGIAKFTNDVTGDVLGQEKLDGLTIVLDYYNGILQDAVTRGNGYIGEVVTHNLKTFKNIPLVIKYKGHLKLRVEALMLIKEFERINVNGEYSNPRNLASGTVRQLDSSICNERNMIAKVFDVVEVEDMSFEKDSEQLEWVKSLGFDVVSYKLFKRDENLLPEIFNFVDDYANSKRKSLEYMIDGIVFKSDDLKERNKLGYTSKWPRWAVAYKFKAMEATTVLRQIVNQVGKTGVITPVAIFDKVNIDVTIERSTLNNYGLIKSLDLKINDTITVIKSNDVIPKITNVIKSKRTGNEIDIVPPSNCPVCGSKTEFINDLLYCTGTNCPAQIKKSLLNFVSRNALNITGLGKETIEDFYENKIITNIKDIYELEKSKDLICKMHGYGLKKYENLIKSIEESKSLNLNNLLLGLSIQLIGDSRAKDLAKHFKDIDNIIKLTDDKELFFEECLSLEDFGPEKTLSLYNYFTDKNNLDLIEFLKTKNVNMKMKETEITKNEFIFGKTFVITGDVFIWNNRKELKTFIENNGGKCTGSVSKKTDYLINNDSTSASEKNKTAKSLAIPIITEEEFKNLI